MRISISELRTLLESSDEFVVRGGRELLVKGVGEPPDAWRWKYFQKALYFTKDELVRAPGGHMGRQVWEFKRDGMMIAVAERDFFTRPE
jgi:hypothetical protein